MNPDTPQLPSTQRRSQPLLQALWYKNPKLADITIIYGPKGEKHFRAHCLILCNAIEWFMRASSNFSEATSPSITLFGDDSYAVDSMLEFAYCNDYTECLRGLQFWRDAKVLFVRHVRVFATADKYQIDELKDLALRNVEEVIRDHVNVGRPESMLRYAIEQMYLHYEDYFPVERFPHPRAPAPTNIVWGDEAGDGQDEDVVIDCSDSHDYDTNITDQMFPESDEDFYHENLPEKMSKHPVERVQAVIVKVALTLWLKDGGRGDDLDAYYLRVLVQKVPEFGSRLAVEALRTGTLRAHSQPEPTDSEWDYLSDDST